MARPSSDWPAVSSPLASSRGEVVAIFLPNSWEFAATYHAATLAGGIPTLLNPTYREREVRYQLENSSAAMLITDGAILGEISLAGLPSLRSVYSTRQHASGTETFADLVRRANAPLPRPTGPRTKPWARFPTPAEPRDSPRA